MSSDTEKLAIDIAADISTRPEFANVESPLILDIVRAALAAHERAQPASVSDEVTAALEVVNDAANDARHRKDYERANALVKARIALWRAAQPASVAGWRPIETAPKDGSAILVWPPTYPSRPCSVARWNDDRYAKKPRPYWEREDTSGFITRSRETSTTHWMPLPAAPQPASHPCARKYHAAMAQESGE